MITIAFGTQTATIPAPPTVGELRAITGTLFQLDPGAVALVTSGIAQNDADSVMDGASFTVVGRVTGKGNRMMPKGN